MAVAALLVGAWACGGTEPADDAAAPDTAPPDAATCRPADEPATWFVFTMLRMPCDREPGLDRVPGFDLDGRVSDEEDEVGCLRRDFTSLDDVRGVDSQMSLMPCPSFNQFVRLGLDGGDFIALLGVHGLDNPENDPCVGVTLRQGRVPEGAELRFDADGIAPLQAFELVDGSSVAPVTGSIVAGTIRATKLTWQLPPVRLGTTDPSTLSLTLSDVELRARPFDDVPENVTTGGRIDVDGYVDAFMAGGAELPFDLIRSTMLSMADLDRDADGMCRGISFSLPGRVVAAIVLD